MWVRIDDGYFSNAKVLRVSGPARYLHITSIIWGAEKFTNYLPRQVLPLLGILAGIPRPALAPAAILLVNEGLWEAVADGWQIHDFYEYHATKEEATIRRAELASKRSAAGRIGALSRWKPRIANR